MRRLKIIIPIVVLTLTLGLLTVACSTAEEPGAPQAPQAAAPAAPAGTRSGSAGYAARGSYAARCGCSGPDRSSGPSGRAEGC